MGRCLLAPFALLLGGILRLRHWCYDRGIFKSYEAGVPTLCIGNLTVGGTGKSPLVADLMARFGTPSGAVVLSRGYGRTTRGYREVRPLSLATEVGDEPLQLKLREPEARVVVCEDRVAGCQRLLETFPDCPCIILDDAFQHRRLRASYNILLSRYNCPYSRDWLLPRGLLRDVRKAAERAHTIALTGIPPEVSESEARALAETLRTNPQQRLLFSTITYDAPRGIWGKEVVVEKGNTLTLAIAGIAQPQPFFDYLRTHWGVTQTRVYPDHYRFNQKDLAELEALAEQGFTIFTTEKDAARLRQYIPSHSSLYERLLYVPIRLQWLWGSEQILERIWHEVCNGRTSERGTCSNVPPSL